MKSPEFMQSLSFRLSLMVAAVVALGICLIAGFFIFQDFRNTIESERARLEDTSHAFAAASSEPLFNRDQTALYQILRGISDVKNTKLIAVLDEQGAMVAQMGSSVELSGRDGLIDEKSIWSLIKADTLSTDTPIWHNGAQIGTLSIHSDISWLRAQYKANFLILLAAALGFAVLIAGVANFVINRALRPLKKMSAELASMGQSPDLAKRFDAKRADEVGVLAGSFNTAFEIIQHRDSAIRQHRDTLESTVQQRTSELKIAADEARQANAAKSEFLATMSHEIRTPMNGMLVMAELLSASELSNRQQRFAEVISRSGNSLLHIINDILDMSKIESGKLELEEIPFSVSALVEDTVSLFSARAHEKALKISMVIPPQIADQSIGDPTRLGQILSNLTNNALKFTDEGGVTIRVALLDTEDNLQKLRFSVSDTGIGIPSEKLDAIFDAFSQADQSTTRNYGGTGLGLSISKRLTEAMNGDISATSIEGEGTTFTVDIALPVHTPARSKALADRPFNIVVSDDSAVSQQATIEMLKHSGLNAFTLDEVGGKPDLVLVSGEEVNLPPALHDVPVITLSDYGNPLSSNGTGSSVGTLSMPINSVAIDRIIECLNNNDWSLLNTDTTIEHADKSLGDFSHLKVLAVDDNAINREVLNEALNALKVKAVFATNGEDAVAMAAKQHFDIIFMDCSMPGMDGYQATAAIRAEGASSTSHIVALTAHVTGEAALRWQGAGMDSYIAKPFTVTQLSGVLGSLDGGTAIAVDADTATDAMPDTPLLSADVLEMFETVSAATGKDMKTNVFSMFCDQIDDAVATLLAHCEGATDSQTLKELAHAVKSMCSSAGAAAAQAHCGEIETDADNEIWPSDVALDNLQKTIAATKSAMQHEMASATPRKNIAQ